MQHPLIRARTPFKGCHHCSCLKRPMMWPPLRAMRHAGNVEGFMVHRTRGDHGGVLQPEIDHELKGKVFYW